MSLYKQGTSQYWWFQIYGPDGKRIRRSTGTADREKAVAIEHTVKMAFAGTTTADKLHSLLDTLCGTRSEGLPLGDVWLAYERWLEAANKKLELTTVRLRRNVCKRFATWAQESYPAAPTAEKVNRACVLAFAQHLAKSGASGKTRKNILNDLGTIWEALRMERDNIVNCWNLVKVDVTDSERGLPFTREQETAILKAAKTVGHGWYEASMIARHTGLRYSDIARIKTEQVNLDKGEIRMRPNKTKRFAIDIASPINSALKPVIESLVKRGGEYLFPEHAAAYPNFGKTIPFRAILEAAKVTTEGHTFHSWRHTFRTRLSEAGVSDDLAKRLGGWTEDTTAARYDHAERVEELRAAVEKAK